MTPFAELMVTQTLEWMLVGTVESIHLNINIQQEMKPMHKIMAFNP